MTRLRINFWLFSWLWTTKASLIAQFLEYTETSLDEKLRDIILHPASTKINDSNRQLLSWRVNWESTSLRRANLNYYVKFLQNCLNYSSEIDFGRQISCLSDFEQELVIRFRMNSEYTFSRIMLEFMPRNRKLNSYFFVYGFGFHSWL